MDKLETNPELAQMRELAATLEQAAIAMLVRDPADHVTYWNQGSQALYGWSREEALGRSSHELLRTVFSQPLGEIQEQLSQSGYWQGELLHATRQGTWVVVESRWSLRRDPQGRALGVLEINHDITKRKQAEQALKESEERYRRLFEDDLTGDYLATPQGRILDCNPAFLAVFGLTSREEARGVNLALLYPRQEEFAHFVEMVRQKGKLEHHRCQRRRLDGSLIQVVENVVGEFGPQGDLAGFKGYLFDNTARHLAEQALKESEERYRRLFQDDLTGDYLATPQGRILDCNPAFLAVFGLASQEEAKAGNLADLYPDPREFARFIQFVRQEGKLEHYQCLRLRRDGSLIHVVENVVGAFDKGGELRQLRGYLYDNTARKQGEEELLRKDQEITLQYNKIKKLNAALTALLERREQELRQKEADIGHTVERLVLPHLADLKATRLDQGQQAQLEVIEGNLKNITSPFARQLATWKTKLTPGEIKVADLIRQGKSSKEIAALLCISSHAVAFHRSNLRAKLGLKSGGGNLASLLRHLD